MDLLYAGTCLLCIIGIIFYIKSKNKYRESNTKIVSPLDTAMIIKDYVVMTFLGFLFSTERIATIKD